MKYLTGLARLCLLWLGMGCGVSLLGEGRPPLDAIHAHWRWSHFDQSSGLPSDHVQQVLQADDGTVWSATSKGVAWYDGYFWHPAEGLEGTAGIRLGAGLRGKVFAFALGCPFEGDRTGFKPAVQPCQSGNWRDGARLDTNAVLLAGATGRPFVFVNGEQRSADIADELSKLSTQYFHQTRGGAVWWADHRGLSRTQNGVSRLLLAAPAVKRWDRAGFHLAGLAENLRGDGVAAVVHPPQLAGIWEWGPGQAPRRVSAPSGLEDVRALDMSADRELVLIHRSGHVWHRRQDRWTEVMPLPRAFEQANDVRFGVAGDLWLATETGVHVYDGRRPGWDMWAHPFPDRRNSVHALLEARDGTVWMANGEGVEQVRFEGASSRLVRLRSHTLGMSTGVAEDGDGNIWVTSGLTYGGAWRWDGRSWRHFGGGEGLTDNRIHGVTADPFGRLWFLALTGMFGDRDEKGGVYCLTRPGLEPVFSQWDERKGLLSNRTYSVAVAADETIFFASQKGLSRYRQGEWRHWLRGVELKNNGLFSVVVDKDGTPYWSDRANGIGTIDSRGAALYSSEADGLISNSIWELHIDRDRALWASGRGGVSVRRGGEWARLGMEQGLPVAELWPVLRQGTQVCLGMAAAGLACLDSATWPARTRTRVLGVEGKDGAVHVTWRAAAWRGHLGAEAIETRYRFDGGPWSDWARRSEVRRTGFGAGGHVVEVESRGMEEGRAPARMEFPVEGPLHRRPVFYLPVGLSCAMALSLLVAFLRRTRRDRLAMQMREHHYRSLIENGLGGVTLVDSQGERTYESPAMQRILGYEPAALGGRPYGSLVHPADLVEFRRMLDECRQEDGAVTTGRYRVLHRDGRWLWVEARVRNLLADPAVRSLVVNYRDVTPQVEAEAELERARDSAESASRVKSEFLATMSHEIRTPMNGITGMTALMLETGLNTEQAEYAGSIRDSAEALVGLINDVLDVARLESGQMTIEQAVFDLRRVVHDVVELLQGVAREKGLQLSESIAPELPGALQGDAGRVRQVVMNLVGNALKFTSKGEVAVRVLSHPEPDGLSLMTIEVEDSGIGIAADKLDSVFDQFVQADASTTRVYGGSGLGLAISRRLARMMGGEITVESELGRGSLFRFQWRLPAAEPAIVKPETRSVDCRGKRILVAEDNPVNQRVALRMLEKLGAAVDLASNGREAVEMALAADYDLVLMDCQMPEMDGFEATRRLRSSPGPRASVTIAALTANAMSGDRERCLAAGMDDFLAKPIDLVRLGELLDRSLSLTR